MLGEPDELTVQAGLLTGPAGDPVTFLAPTWCGDPDEGSGVLERLAKLGDPLVARFAPTTVSGMLAQAGAMFPFGRHVEIRPRNVPALTPAVRTALVAAGSGLTSPLSAVSLHSLHGAAARVPAADTAFAARAPHVLVETVAQWQPDDPRPARHRDWARKLSAALAAAALPGGYPNLLAPDETGQISHAYGSQLDRLLAVKRAVDPDGVFSATPLPASPVP
jgi:hypothetical protein